MKKKVLVFLIITILFVGFFAIKETKAGAEHNVYGWAWAGPTIGWVSFNSTNTGWTTNYGVHLCVDNGDPICAAMTGDRIGRLTGYAWMGSTDPSFGWIDFSPDPNLIAFPGCGYPATPCYTACLDVPAAMQETAVQPCDGTGDWTFSGWARALSLDSWIKLRGTWVDPVTLNISLSPSPREFEGWAWGDGGSVLSWISFNCENREVATGKTCLNGDDPAFDPTVNLVDYKVMTDLVINPVPSANNLNRTEENYCNCGPTQITKCSGSKSQPPIYLDWTFNDPGDTQSAYQIEIHRNSSYTSLAIDSGKVPTSGPGPDYSYVPPGLAFGTQYWWRLKVWDSGDPAMESSWINAPASFTTATHRWPNTDFTPSLLNPPAGVEVKFTDNSKCYTAAGGEYDCKGGAASYNWDFDYDPAEGFTIDSTTQGDAAHTYAVSGNYIVRLEVTDSMCPCVFPLTATLPLPTWKEIAPF